MYNREIFEQHTSRNHVQLFINNESSHALEVWWNQVKTLFYKQQNRETYVCINNHYNFNRGNQKIMIMLVQCISFICGQLDSEEFMTKGMKTPSIPELFANYKIASLNEIYGTSEFDFNCTGRFNALTKIMILSVYAYE